MITLDAQKFLFAAKWCNRIVPKHPVLSVTSKFYCEIKDLVLTVRSTNIETHFKISYETKNDNCNFLVSTNILKSLVGANKLEISISDNSTTYIIDETITINETENIAAYLDFPQYNVEDFFVFDIESKYLKLQNFKKMTTSDEMRPAMTGVNILTNVNQLELTASDGHKLLTQKYTIGINNENINVVAPIKFINLLSLFKGKKINFKFSLDAIKKHISVNFSWHEFDFQISTISIGQKYPDFKAVIPFNPPNKLTLKKSNILPLLKKCLPFTNQITNQIDIDLISHKLIARDLEYMVDFSAFVDMAIEVGNKDEFSKFNKIRFNARILIDLLECANEKIEFGFSIPNKPFVIIEEDQTLLIMPIIIYE